MAISTPRRRGAARLSPLALLTILAVTFLLGLGEIPILISAESDVVSTGEKQQESAADLASAKVEEETGTGAVAEPENTPEEPPTEPVQQCSGDSGPLQALTDMLKKQLSTTEEDNAALMKEVTDLKDQIAEATGVLDAVGGKEGIDRLIKAAATATSATEMGQEAVQRALEENEGLQTALDAAQDELEELRRNLSKAEQKASEAGEEVSRHANSNQEVVRKLERTESELFEAKLPRQVSVKAIMADVNHLGNELLDQTAAARDDIIAATNKKVEEAQAVVLPYWNTAVETTSPYVENAMAATESQRAQALEAFFTCKEKFDASVTEPANEKWTNMKQVSSEYLEKVVAQWDKKVTASLTWLVAVGISEPEAQRMMKYMNIVSLCVIAVLFFVYMGGSIWSYIVMPVLRRVLRLTIWLIKIPFRILFLPIRLVLWVLGAFYRMAFGGGKNAKAGGAGKGAGRSSSKVKKAKKIN